MRIKYITMEELDSLADQDKREKNIERCESNGFEYCYICGRKVSDADLEKLNNGSGEGWIHGFEGGAKWTTADVKGIPDDGANLGCWAVGSTCYKKFLKLLHE